MFSNKDESVWHAEWGGQIIYSHGSEHSRGVTLLVMQTALVKKQQPLTWTGYTPILIKVAPVNHVSLPAMHHGQPFCSRKFSLVRVHWNNGDHLWEGIQRRSFQVKWLLKFLGISELKNFIFKISYYKIGSLFFFKWIGFYRLIKLRFCMGQNAGYFNKANRPAYSFFFFQFQKNCLKQNQTRNVKLFIVVQQTPWIWFFLTPSKIPTCAS